MKKIKKLKGKRLNQLQPLPQTLRLLAILQLDENYRVGKVATSCLSRAAANLKFRQKGIESIEQIARLYLSEMEDVRNAARETTLSFGEKGRLAFEKMDRICCELQETMYQEAEFEITVL
ncbi:hypothetical protein lerEdw1_014746 [Lerista edwardsae]|nr:hypothetical protein lerEdw1_014750 [Lerista edwardsae]KAJ6626776.1 hypothetical protein lerEdw1_014746 [Lerista edwardsae]